MNCHRCGACCVEISISSPIPGMPAGKPAGVRCVHLTNEGLCAIFGNNDRPAICSSLNASKDICGNNAKEATALIRWYERQTAP